MGMFFARRLVVMILPLLATWIIPHLLIDRPVLSKAWSWFGPSIVSAASEAIAPEDPARADTPEPSPVTPGPGRVKPPIADHGEISIRWPGGGITIPSWGD